MSTDILIFHPGQLGMLPEEVAGLEGDKLEIQTETLDKMTPQELAAISPSHFRYEHDDERALADLEIWLLALKNKDPHVIEAATEALEKIRDNHNDEHFKKAATDILVSSGSLVNYHDKDGTPRVTSTQLLGQLTPKQVQESFPYPEEVQSWRWVALCQGAIEAALANLNKARVIKPTLEKIRRHHPDPHVRVAITAALPPTQDEVTGDFDDPDPSAEDVEVWNHLLINHCGAIMLRRNYEFATELYHKLLQPKYGDLVPMLEDDNPVVRRRALEEFEKLIGEDDLNPGEQQTVGAYAPPEDDTVINMGMDDAMDAVLETLAQGSSAGAPSGELLKEVNDRVRTIIGNSGVKLSEKEIRSLVEQVAEEIQWQNEVEFPEEIIDEVSKRAILEQPDPDWSMLTSFGKRRTLDAVLADELANSSMINVRDLKEEALEKGIPLRDLLVDTGQMSSDEVKAAEVRAGIPVVGAAPGSEPGQRTELYDQYRAKAEAHERNMAVLDEATTHREKALVDGSWSADDQERFERLIDEMGLLPKFQGGYAPTTSHGGASQASSSSLPEWIHVVPSSEQRPGDAASSAEKPYWYNRYTQETSLDNPLLTQTPPVKKVPPGERLSGKPSGGGRNVNRNNTKAPEGLKDQKSTKPLGGPHGGLALCPVMMVPCIGTIPRRGRRHGKSPREHRRPLGCPYGVSQQGGHRGEKTHGASQEAAPGGNTDQNDYQPASRGLGGPSISMKKISRRYRTSSRTVTGT